MSKKSLLALLIAVTFPVYAASPAYDYFVVVPVPGKGTASAAIAVTLASYTLPNGVAGVPYAGFNLASLLSVTGDPSYAGAGAGTTFAVVGGSLPPGLVLNKDGSITGTPTAGGSATFKVRASYKAKNGEQAYQIVVATINVGLAAGSPPQALVGQGYSYDLRPLLTVTGDNAYPGNGAGVTWNVVSSSLPDGLYLTSDGFIAGTPTAAGTGSIAVQASYRGASGQQTYQVVSLKISVSLEGAELKARVRQPFTYDFTPLLHVTGDPGFSSSGASWELSAGVLPDGLSFDSTGRITGTPTKISSSYVKVIATYKNAQGLQGYNIQVAGQQLIVTQIAAGGYHTCAVTTAGGVKCWGDNTYGQLGNGGTVSSASPVSVSGLTSGVASIAVGLNHTCAVTTAGEAKCWGQNTNGQLGTGSTTNSSVPVAVSGLTAGVARVYGGAGHTCALTQTGGAKCWGQNTYGQLGDNTNTNSSVPVDVLGLTSGVASLAAGSAHNCAVTVTGGAKCWGYGNGGQLGNGSIAKALTPTDVYGLQAGVASIAAGSMHTCAVTTAGGVKCWGTNSYGQLGNNSTTLSSVPVDVIGLASGVSSVSGGNSHACAITTTGGVTCWGLNSLGQLGDGSKTNRLVPVNVSGLSSGVASVVTGTGHSCAVLAADGSAQCWGNNSSAQLGNGNWSTSTYPVEVVEP